MGATELPAAIEKSIYGTQPAHGAPGQELYLYTVTIPPGAQISAHTHPGTQIAHILEGTLTYEVLNGSATVIRDAGTDEETREVVSATAVELAAGDGVIEEPGMVHQASNNGPVPVHIVLSSLFPEGDELSSPVPAGPSPAP